MDKCSSSLIVPNWPAPKSIKSFSTTRVGGISEYPFDDFNLAQHVSDDSQLVTENRGVLQNLTQHPDNPLWLEQVHSNEVVEYNLKYLNSQADGCYSQNKSQVCLIMTADCLPVLFCSNNADFVAASHAGWRGLANGILKNTVSAYQSKVTDAKSNQLMAWVGPAISKKHFEVGADVFEIFTKKNVLFQQFFTQKEDDQSSLKYHCDLAAIAEHQLRQLGVDVYQSGLCSFDDRERFYSYRRDGETGRMASLIWME